MPPILHQVLAVAILGIAPLAADAADITIDSKTFHLPTGFSIEKVAGPPLVNRPVTADFDDQGRLYVTDNSGTGDNLQKQLKDPPHRILRLEDTDGDGRFDKQTLFADHVMFPEGTLWLDGSLYVAAVPSIWKFTGQERSEWFQGKTMTGCGNDLHGPYLSPDGWIYWCKGAFAQQTYDRPGHKPLVTRAAHILRARPDGSGIEPVMTGGMDNPVEVVFTPGGERIFTTTFLVNPAAGQRDGIIHAIYGGIYGKIHDVIDDHPHTFPEVMPVMIHTGPAAQCALVRYESAVFGGEYQDNLFASSFNLHKVTRHILTPDGATFKSKDEDFLTCDSFDFHPTHLIEDADGSLLVIDTGGWYKLCCPTSQLGKPDVTGAIYRIRKTGAPKVEDPRGLKLAWGTMKPEELALLLGDPSPAVQKRAIQALGKLGVAALPALKNVLSKSDSSKARLNAVWATTWITDPKARKITRIAFSDRDETVLQAAIHSASVWRDHDALPDLAGLLRADSMQNRRAAAEALGRLGSGSAVPNLIMAWEKPVDHVLEHSLTYALIEISDPSTTALGLALPNPHVRRAAMMALDQMETKGGLGAQTVIDGLLADDESLRSTAAWIASHHPEWGDEMAGALRKRISTRNLPPREQTDLEHQLSKLAKSPAIASLLTDRLRNGAPQERHLALNAMAGANLKPLPPDWTSTLTSCLDDKDPQIVSAAIVALHRLSNPKEKSSTLTTQLLATANRQDLPPTTRLEALAAIPNNIESLPPTLFQFTLKELAPTSPIANRMLAADALAKSKLSSQELQDLTQLLPTSGPLEINKLLAAYSQSTDDQVGLSLISALEHAKAAKSLRIDLLRPHLAQFGPTVQSQANTLFAKLDPDSATQKSHLDAVEKSLPPGDIRRGQSIFNSQKAACATCHTIGYVGGNVGPDLTRIGGIRKDRDLLESILYPSASFVQSYEPFTVFNKKGDRYDGVLRKNDAEEVMLVTGPNQEVHIPRPDIKEMRPGTVSVMPGGLEEQLTKQDLADLVAFLKASK